MLGFSVHDDSVQRNTVVVSETQGVLHPQKESVDYVCYWMSRFWNPRYLQRTRLDILEESEQLKQFRILDSDQRSLYSLIFIDLPKIPQPANSRTQVQSRISLPSCSGSRLASDLDEG